MSGTLAEAKASLGHQNGLIAAHVRGCDGCRLKGRQACAEGKALRAEATRMRKAIASWFAPQPGDAALFDAEGP